MSASRYSLQHSKIIKITGGAGGLRQGWDAAKGAAKDSLKIVAKEEGKIVVKGGGVALIFTVGMDVAEWYRDYSEIGRDGKPKKDIYDLISKAGTDLVKAGLIAALTTAIVAIGIGFLATSAVAATAPVFAVVVGTIVVTGVLTYFVEKGDRTLGRALGTDDSTTWVAQKFREIAEKLSEVSKDVRYEYYPAIAF